MRVAVVPFIALCLNIDVTGFTFFGALIAQEAQDQASRERQLPLGIDQGPVHAVDDRLERNPATCMRLRIEEDLHMANILRDGAFQVGPGQLVEVTLFEKHSGAEVVDVQKGAGIREIIGAPRLLHGVERECDLVSRGHREHQLRLERAFDVKVELRLWQAPDERLHIFFEQHRRLHGRPD